MASLNFYSSVMEELKGRLELQVNPVPGFHVAATYNDLPLKGHYLSYLYIVPRIKNQPSLKVNIPSGFAIVDKPAICMWVSTVPGNQYVVDQDGRLTEHRSEDFDAYGRHEPRPDELPNEMALRLFQLIRPCLDAVTAGTLGTGRHCDTCPQQLTCLNR